MSIPFGEFLEMATANLREHQQKIEQVSRELKDAEASATSKDRMVTAKVGAQGQVLALTFHTTDYRTMAPAKLATVLVDLLNEARAKVGEQVTESMKGLELIQKDLNSALIGGTGIEELLEPLRAMRPGYAEEQEKNKRTAERQEEFHG